MSNAPKKSIPRPGRKPAAEPVVSPEAPPTESSSRRIALLAAQAGLEKKATGVQIIDVTGKVDYADYLVLMSGASDRNVAAIAQEVDASLAKAGFRSMSVEGLPVAQWVLIDFVDVVVHVFQKDVRSLYDLDGLWMDADRVPMAGANVEDEDDGSVAGDRVLMPSKRPRAKAASKRPTKKAKTAASPRGGATRRPASKTSAKPTLTRKSATGKATRKAKTTRKPAK